MKAPTEQQKLLGIPAGFDDYTRVYVTLPGGKRTSFTFNPYGDRLNSFLGSYGSEALWYHPAFKSDDGSDVTLSVDDVRLVKGTDGKYYDLGGAAFNPENPRFGGTYTLTTKEGIEYKIDAVSGDLLMVTDTNDNTLTYSDSGIVSSTGQSVTFERNAAGQIVAAVDPFGNKIQYEYDDNGDLVAVTDREENTTRFEYHEERSHYLEEVIDPLGRSGVRSEYDESGRMSRMLDVNGEAVELVYDPDNSTQTVLDVFGNPTTYVYDSRGNVLTEVDPVGLITQRTYDEDNNVLTETVITEESGAEGWTTTRTYDGQGNKLSETDPLGNVSRWTYNNLGQVLTETDPLGNTTTNTYSPSGNLLSTTDAEGNVTEFSYDIRGNVISLTGDSNSTANFSYYADGNVKNIEDNLGNQGNYTYDANGKIQSEILKIAITEGEQTVETTWTYDNEGRIKSVVSPDQEIEYRYDEAGNQIQSISFSEQTDYRYDDKGQLVETIYDDDTPENPDDNYRTITVYDRGGLERANFSQNGRVTHFEYDAAGRLTATIYDSSSDAVENLVAAVAPEETVFSIDWTEVIYPDSTPAYLNENPRTSTEYYQNGWVKAEIDETGERVEYKYDAIGRQSEVRYDENNYVTYTYDKAGNRQTETYHAQGTTLTNVYDELGQLTSETDQNNRTTQYEYGENGQLIAVIDARGGRTEYEYNDSGNLLTIKDALSQVTTYEYDESGRQTGVILPDGKRETSVYNDAENSVTITDFNGESIKHVYDEQGNLKQKEFLSSGTSVSYEYDASSRTESYTSSQGTTVYKYDESDRLISRTDPEGPYLPSGTSIEYEYDDGFVVAVKTPENVTTYTYESGLLKTVSNPDIGTTTYFYEPDNTFKTQFPNNVLETRSYDELGRLKRIETAKIDPATGENVEIISSYDYQLDNVGNRLSVTEHSGRQVKYEYDALHRVIKEEILNDPDGNNRVITYTYDDVGNRLEKNDSISGITTYTYNELNQLERETTNGVTTTYTYDDNGNLVSEVTGKHSTTYHWANDGENRLIGVTIVDEDGTQNIEYEYNARGIRVAEIIDGVETRFLIDDLRPYAQVLEEYDAAGNVQTSYTYGYDLISQQQGAEELFYHVDALGSSRVLTSESGGVSNTYNYDAYGNLIQQVDSEENSYLFAGEQRDFETGLDYLRARYYDPAIGRFISADAYDGSLNDPMSLHDYQYAHANPVVNIDPSGYFTLKETLESLAFHSILVPRTANNCDYSEEQRLADISPAKWLSQGLIKEVNKSKNTLFEFFSGGEVATF